jgi:hypothetical protein
VSVVLEQPRTSASAAQHGTRLPDTARAGVLYLALTLLLTWPLSLNPASTAAPGDPDTDLFVWTLAWNTHALTSNPLALFDANIYHPHPRTLAFSENLVGSTLFAAPVLWLTGDHVLALNVVGLSAVVLCGLGAFVLARRLGLGFHAALLCGIVFAFAPSRLLRMGQIHLSTIQWIPFCLAYLHAYLDHGRRRHLWLAVGFFSLQALTSGHGASFLVVGLTVVLGYRLAMGEPIEPWRRVRDFGLTGVGLLVPTALIYSPYREVQLEFGLRRSLADWPPRPENFLASPTGVHRQLVSLLPDLGIYEHANAFLFPGVLPLLLAAAALAWWPGHGRAWSPPTAARRLPDSPWSTLRIAAWAAEGLAVAGLAVGLFVAIDGPFLWRVGEVLVFTARRAERGFFVCALALAIRLVLATWVPLDLLGRMRRLRVAWTAWGAAKRHSARAPYAWLTLACVSLAGGQAISVWPYVHHLPGLSFIRVPSRFMILAVLGLAVLAAIGFERVVSRLSPRRAAAAAAAIGVLLAIEFAALPFPGSRPYHVQIPAVDRWLAARPTPFVVAEFPANGYDERLQSTYMLHSMAHWQKTVHGHSGLRTALHVELYRTLRTFPDEPSLTRLRELGVDYIVVHRDMYTPDDWRATEERWDGFAGCLGLEHTGGGGAVYSLTLAAPECPLRAQ